MSKWMILGIIFSYLLTGQILFFIYVYMRWGFRELSRFDLSDGDTIAGCIIWGFFWPFFGMPVVGNFIAQIIVNLFGGGKNANDS